MYLLAGYHWRWRSHRYGVGEPLRKQENGDYPILTRCALRRQFRKVAAGRPVIASVRPDSGTAEMIREGNCGWVVPCQDAASLAEAIRNAADDRATTSRLGLNGRELLLAAYGREKCTGMYEAILTGRCCRDTFE